MLLWGGSGLYIFLGYERCTELGWGGGGKRREGICVSNHISSQMQKTTVKIAMKNDKN